MEEFRAYTGTEVSIDTINRLEEFYGSQQPLNKGIFAALGSYWREYYRNTDILNVLETGIQQVVSQEYLNLMHMVLSSNVLNIPTRVENRFNLFVFNSSLAEYVCETGTFSFSELTGRETILYIKYPIDLDSISGIGAFVNYLLEPTVGLTSGDWFVIDPSGYLKFYTDIFRDSNITKETYFSYNSNTRETFVLLWGVDVVLTSYNIYEKYGTFLYPKEADSQAYKLLITALQFFYVNTKTVNNIESAINILMGMPFCISYGEVVTAIAPRVERYSYTQVVTTHNVYEAPFYSEVVVQVGDTLSVGSLVARWSIVSDYISNPTWHCDYNLPYQLLDSFINPVVSTEAHFIYYNGGITYNGEYFYSHSIEQSRVVDPFGYGSCRFPYQLFDTFNHPVEERSPSTNIIYDMEQALGYAKKWYKARRDSEYVTERWLYSILDSFLRYNLIQIKTSLTLESVYYYRDVLGLFRELIRGIPFYLFPNIDTVLYAIIEEEAVSPTDDLDWVALMQFAEDISYPGTLFYDGSIAYSGSSFYDIPGTGAVREESNVSMLLGFEEYAIPYGGVVVPGVFSYDGSFYYNDTQYYSPITKSTTEDGFENSIEFVMEEGVSSPTSSMALLTQIMDPLEGINLGMTTVYYNSEYDYSDMVSYLGETPSGADDTDFVLNIIYA